MAEQATVVIRVNSDQAEEAIEDLNDELDETTLKAARAGEAVDDVAGEGAATSIRVVGEAAEEAGEGFDSMGTRSRSAKRAVLRMADEAGEAALAFTSLSSSAQVVLGTLVGGGAAVAGGVGLAGAATMLSKEFGSAGIRGEIELLESQLKATLENALKPWEGLIRGEVIPSVRQGAKAVASWSDELASFSGLMVDVAQTLETPFDVLLPLEVFNEKDRKALRNLDRITKEQLNELGNARSQGQGQQGRPTALPPDSLTSPAERAAGVGAVAVSTQGTREVLPEEATGPSEKELKEKRQDIFKKVLDPLQRKIQVINSLPFLSKEEKLKRKRDVLRKIVRQLVKTDKKLTETQDLPNIVKETKIDEFLRKLRAARRQLNRLKAKELFAGQAARVSKARRFTGGKATPAGTERLGSSLSESITQTALQGSARELGRTVQSQLRDGTRTGLTLGARAAQDAFQGIMSTAISEITRDIESSFSRAIISAVLQALSSAAVRRFQRMLLSGGSGGGGGGIGAGGALTSIPQSALKGGGGGSLLGALAPVAMLASLLAPAAMDATNTNPIASLLNAGRGNGMNFEPNPMRKAKGSAPDRLIGLAEGRVGVAESRIRPQMQTSAIEGTLKSLQREMSALRNEVERQTGEIREQTNTLVPHLREGLKLDPHSVAAETDRARRIEAEQGMDRVGR